MDKLIPIKIPLLNPNEPEALLASLNINEGDPVKSDDVIALIETTKSTGEVMAGSEGYVVGLRFKEGDTLEAGDVLAYIGETPAAIDLSLPPWAEGPKVQEESTSVPEGLRITEPARELALEEGLKMDELPHGPLVTRQMVQGMLASRSPQQQSEVPQGENRLVIYGAGGHGQSLAALIRKLRVYEIIGFIDDDHKPVSEIYGIPVLGSSQKLAELVEQGIRLAINGVGGIGDLQSRLKVDDMLRQAGFQCPSVVHPAAFLEDGSELADGVQIFPFAYVGTQVRIGYGSIINTGAIVSHDCALAQFVNLSPGATLAGGVRVDEGVLIGMRATVNLRVHIGNRARIGNGATVKADVPEGGIVPAGSTWPLRR